MTEHTPSSAAPDDEPAPISPDETTATATAPRRPLSHSRIAALCIAAAVLLTAGAGAGAWAATAAGLNATTTSIGTPSTGTGSQGGQALTGPGFGGQAFGGSGAGSSSSGSATVNSSVATPAQRVGVVTIVSQLGYANGESAGTGIVLTPTGRILTNNHVIAGATAITVTDQTTNRSYTARVVGTNPTSDIAVLQLQNASGLATATLATTAAAVGDQVTAVGNANGTGTLTAAPGSISRVNEQITTQSDGTSAGETLNGLIETTANVVSGDSGGPLKNAAGAVVGINTAASSGGSSITGYAIPISTALSIARQIVAGSTAGGITQGYPAFLGVSLSSSSAASSSSATSGALVVGALNGTPAANAGIGTDSVITAVDGTAISSSDALTKAIGAHKPGDQVRITWTDASGASHTATVVLAEGPAN